MKKVLILGVFLVGALKVIAGPVLLEEHQITPIAIPVGEVDTVIVAEVSFSVDTACYVQMVTGGMAKQAKGWLDIDGVPLPPSVIVSHAGQRAPVNIVYIYLVEEGEHSIAFMLTNYYNMDYFTTCDSGYLQALIFLPDAGSAVAEQPTSGNGLKPIVNTPSVVSSGPYVTVTGATELVDATGRVIENAIEEDRVSINNLSQGTYFARKEGKTLVKIVKVQ